MPVSTKNIFFLLYSRKGGGKVSAEENSNGGGDRGCGTGAFNFSFETSERASSQLVFNQHFYLLQNLYGMDGSAFTKRTPTP